MLPLLLGAGRMLAAGAVRGAAAGATRGAIAQSVKKATVETAKKKAGGLAKSFIKKKITNAKKVSTGKLLPRSKKGGGGGGLVRKKSSAIVKRPTTSIEKISGKEKEEEKQQKQEEKKPFNADELIQELTAIKETLVKIKGVLGTNLANTLRNQKNQRILRSKQKASEKESELEKKPEKKQGGTGLKVPKKGMSFLDMIWNFISNVLLGSLLNFAWKYIPQIIKMFSEIAEGMTNTWQQLRIGIITLTTLFPKQIKFLAKLTSKIVGPPAKLIGKLLRKAGNIAGNLFKKAGGIVLNLIKGPLLNLVRRVGGEALEQGVKGAARGAARIAGKAAGAAGSAIASSGRLLNRLKIFSKVFKRIPVVGMLIGVGIDLAMGERLDKALIGAAGAALGTTIGSLIGQGLIPIPGLGALVGGAVGGAIGDWGAKKLYGHFIGSADAAEKAAPLERRYAAGRVGGSRSAAATIRRNTAAQGKPPVASSKISPDVEVKAQKDVLKDEKSLERFKSLSSIFAGTPFVGQLLKLGIDIGMGAKVQKTQTDAAAQDLGFTIGRAMENDEFTVPGLNKRIIGPLSRNLTEWAKKKIFYEVKSREGSFPRIDGGGGGDEGQKGTPGDRDGGGPGGGGGGGGSGSSYGVPEVRALLDAISFAEGTTKSYGVISGGDVNKDLEAGKLTVREVIALGNTFGKPGSKHKWSGATGRYQFMPGTLNGMVSRGKLKYDDLFTPAKQDEAAWMLVQARGVTLDQLKKEGLSQSVADKLAPEWASFPYSPKGGKSYHGQGYKSLASLKKVYDEKLKIRQEDIAKSGGRSGDGHPTSKDDTKGDAKNKKIFLHWTAGSHSDNRPVSGDLGYHTYITGPSGTPVYYKPYGSTPPYHTYKRTGPNYAAISASGMSTSDEGNTKSWGSQAITSAQWNSMAAEAAKLAQKWGWKKGDITDKTVRTHSEEYRDYPSLYRRNVRKDYRWDLDRLYASDPKGSGPNKIRNMIKSHMGGGVGNGGSIKKHKVPEFILGGGRILTSGMGMRDFALSPGMHMGVDIHGTTGEPLQAFSDGVVEGVGYEANGYGHWVSWIDDKGIGHFYGHMNKPAFVKKGQKVKKGTILGELGSTGRSSGPHLHWEAATKPSDTGQSKSAVLSRFNPLSKYGIDAPFGGTTRPDPKLAADTSRPGQAPSQPGAAAPGSPGTSKPALSASDLSFSIKGDPAKQSYISSLKGKGKGMGGGAGSGAITWKEWGKYLRGLGFVPNENAWDPGTYDNSQHSTPDHGHNAMDAGWWKDDNYVANTKKWEKIFAPLEGDAFRQVIGPIEDPAGHGNGTNTHLHFTAKNLDSKGLIPLTPKLKALMGNPNPTATADDPGPGNAPAAQPGQSGTPAAPKPALSASDLSFSIKGDPAKQSYIDSLKKAESNAEIAKPKAPNVDALKQKPSYDQGNSTTILASLPQQPNPSTNSNVSMGRSPGYVGSSLNSNDIASSSILQIMSSAFYKI